MTSKATQTVRVTRESLLQEVQASLVQAEEEYEKALDDYSRDLDEWKKVEKALLMKALDRVDRGNFDVSPYRCHKIISFLVGHSDAPESPGNPTDAIKRDIKLLELSADDTIAVPTDSKWTRYL